MDFFNLTYMYLNNENTDKVSSNPIRNCHLKANQSNFSILINYVDFVSQISITNVIIKVLFNLINNADVLIYKPIRFQYAV